MASLNIRLAKVNGHFDVDLGEDTTFGESGRNFKITTATKDMVELGRIWEYKPVVRFRADNASIEIRESWTRMNGTTVLEENAAAIRVPLSRLSTIVYRPSEDGSYFVMGFVVKDNATLGPITYSAAQPTQGYGHLVFKQLERFSTLTRIRAIRLKFYKYQANRFLNLHEIRKILDSEKTMEDLMREFAKAQKTAMTSETAAWEARITGMTRENCLVHVYATDIYPNRLVLTIDSNIDSDKWDIENGTKLMLLDRDTFKSPAPAPDAHGNNSWTADVVSINHRDITAIINNPVENPTRYLYKQLRDVCISVVESNPLADRLGLAVDRVRDCFDHELGKFEVTDKTEYVKLTVPLSRLFIQHDDNRISGWSVNPISLINGADRITYEPSWALEASHKLVIDTIVSGFGLTGIQGPPGTGKSTLMAKCVAILVSKYILHGKIVLSAHSNQATQVLLEKCHHVFRLFDLDPTEHIVLVETPGGAQRRRRFGRTLPIRLESYSLEAQIALCAQTNPERYSAYTVYHNSIITGKDLTIKERRQYYNARDMLVRQLRDSRTVFICTLSSINTRFFHNTNVKPPKPFRCSVLFADETSQAPTPAFLEAWQSLNPDHIVIGGDAKQLQCYAESKAAKQIWAGSPIVYVQKLGPKVCTMLNVQFRMPKHVYEPTNQVHYDGKVATASVTLDRPSVSQLVRTIKSIEVDPFGNDRWRILNNNVMVFDLDDSKQHHYGSSSSVNPLEADVVFKFITCLHAVGISFSEIMALTPYEGQYQELMSRRKKMDAVDLAVRKIDSSQGAENHIVVFSPTKTDRLGFMSSTQRQNVATSRQRSAFFLVGKLSVLTRDGTWKSWFNELQRANEDHGVCYMPISINCRFRPVPGYTRYDHKSPPKPTSRPPPPSTITSTTTSPSTTGAMTSIARELQQVDALPISAPEPSIAIKMEDDDQDAATDFTVTSAMLASVMFVSSDKREFLLASETDRPFIQLSIYSNEAEKRFIVELVDTKMHRDRTICVLEGPLVLEVYLYEETYCVKLKQVKHGVLLNTWVFNLAVTSRDQARTARELWNHICKAFKFIPRDLLKPMNFAADLESLPYNFRQTILGRQGIVWNHGSFFTKHADRFEERQFGH